MVYSLETLMNINFEDSDRLKVKRDLLTSNIKTIISWLNDLRPSPLPEGHKYPEVYISGYAKIKSPGSET